jgi:hypothetical protein
MRKLLAVALSVLFVVATAAPLMATQARQIALGGVGNYIEDDYNIFSWPATLPSYSNTLWMGVMNTRLVTSISGSQSWSSLSSLTSGIGGSYGLGSEKEYGTIAMFLYDRGPGLNPFEDRTFSGDLANKFTLMYAYPTESVSFGFFFSRSDEGITVDTPAEEDHASYTTFGGGIRFDLGEKAYMDIAADLSMASYQDEQVPTYNSLSEDANMMMGLKARIFYEWNETITWVPYLSYRQFDFSIKADTLQDQYLEDNFGDKAMMFDIGLGANIKVNEDNLLVFAIEPMSYMKWEPSELPAGAEDVSLKQMVMPRFYLALESDVRDWLTFRAGANKSLVKNEYKNLDLGDGVLNETVTGGAFNYFMGLGFHVSDFDIDCVINNDLPMRLGYWLTGYNGYYSDEPVYMVNAAYHF